MTDIEWVDELPPDPTSKGRHFEIAAELRERPGQWAMIARNVSPGVGSSLKTKAAYQPKADFEFTTRKVGDNYARRTIYARYVGKLEKKAD